MRCGMFRGDREREDEKGGQGRRGKGGKESCDVK